MALRRDGDFPHSVVLDAGGSIHSASPFHFYGVYYTRRGGQKQARRKDFRRAIHDCVSRTRFRSVMKLGTL